MNKDALKKLHSESGIYKDRLKRIQEQEKVELNLIISVSSSLT